MQSLKAPSGILNSFSSVFGSSISSSSASLFASAWPFSVKWYLGFVALDGQDTRSQPKDATVARFAVENVSKTRCYMFTYGDEGEDLRSSQPVSSSQSPRGPTYQAPSQARQSKQMRSCVRASHQMEIVLLDVRMRLAPSSAVRRSRRVLVGSWLCPQ
jgi:hypothetical protein